MARHTLDIASHAECQPLPRIARLMRGWVRHHFYQPTRLVSAQQNGGVCTPW
jgi:hypothetical protein